MGVKFNPFTSKLDIVDSPSGEFSDIELALGTQTAPSLSFTGDSNTGIYSPGADQVALTTAGSERLRITSDGKVGIGITSVDTNLHVAGSGQQILKIQDTGNTNGLDLGNNTTESFISTADNKPITFYTNNLERLRITSDGKLGLGTTDPGSFNAVLAVQKNQTADTAIVVDNSGTANASTSSSFIVADGGSARGWFRRYRDGTGNTAIGFTDAFLFEGNINGTKGTRMVIDSSGRVGIGTTSPNYKLSVNAGAANTAVAEFTGTATGRGLLISTNNDGGVNDDSVHYNAQRGSGNHIFEVGSTELARIDSSGRLLVGTSSSRIVEDLLGNGPQGLIQIEAANSDAIMSIISAGTADAGRAGTLSLGRHRNSTVGGTPTVVQSGDTLGAICFAGGDGTDMRTKGASIACQVDGTPGANDMPGRLVFSTTADGASSPTERMRIKENGNLLINTTTEGAGIGFSTKLAIEGTDVAVFKNSAGSSANLIYAWNAGTSGNNAFIGFGTEGTYTARGSINYNRSGGVVAYNTTSDYRAKTLIGEIENPGETIDALKVYRGVMNGATVERPMLVAHEAQEVAPYCVTGEKDAVDDDGNPIYQQMDHQVLVPLLIAEIQQLRARVAALESN